MATGFTMELSTTLLSPLSSKYLHGTSATLHSWSTADKTMRCQMAWGGSKSENNKAQKVFSVAPSQ